MALVAAAALRRRARAPRRRGAQAEPGLLRVHGAAGQGLQHRDEPRGREPRRAGARRHGLHRGDRRRAALPRRQDPDDLRRHDGDPGQRPGRPQDGARRRRDGAWRSPRRSRPPKRELAERGSVACARDAQAPAARRARPSSTWSSSSSARRKADPNAVFAGRVPYLMLAGNLMAGWQMARALLVAEDALAAGEDDAAFMQAKIATARFYADHILSRVPGRCATASSTAPTSVTAHGARGVLSPSEDRWRCRRSCEPAAADHRRAAVHHQQPQARDRAVHGGHRRLDAGAQRAPGRAARRVAGRDHRDAGGLEPRRTPSGRRRRSRSTRSCTRATTGSSTTCRCARSTRCRSSSPRWARAPTSTTRCTAGAASCCTTSSTTPSRTRRSTRAPTG